jgi:predicted ArsR family transcriptional regulator
MTPSNARHHLGILAADGRVEVISQRQGGRGRPEKVYRLAGTLVGDNLSVLVDALLAEADEDIEIEAVGRRIAGEHETAAQPLMHRLVSTVERLSAMHYQARWEAGAEGPRVILGHCPYVGLVEKHPQLCQMDVALLAELLGGEVHQTAMLEMGAGDKPFCAFVLI